MNSSILLGILIFGIVQALFFALLFSTKSHKSLHDKIVGIWLLILALQIVFISINYSKGTSNLIFKSIQISFLLLHGPFLYLYSKKLSTGNTIFSKIDFLHFIPFVFLIIIIFLIASLHFNIDILVKIVALTGIISGLSYCIATYLLVQNHKKQIVYKFSYTENINLTWISQLTIGILILWIGGSICGILVRFLNLNLPITWLFAFVPLFIFYIGFYSIKQKLIYTDVNKESPLQKVTKSKKLANENKSYKKSGLTKDRMQSILNLLKKSMEVDTLFLDPTLSLSSLSEQLNIPAHHITQTLNEYADQALYDFVNKFRVEEFKKRVFAPENKDFSLLGIALDCGFNSKSSFNRIFKKYTNQTPTEYIKK